MKLPECKELLLHTDGPVLHITLNRPAARNAMNRAMVDELMAVFRAVADSPFRVVVLRGADGHFCAGGDIKDMAAAHQRAAEAKNDDAYYELNRAFGRLITDVEHAPQVVIALLQGAVMGGGFGLACVSDIAIADSSARFGLPETGLGIPPAQIAPFVVKRIGLTQARRLALTGERFDAGEALRLGLIHYCCDSAEAMAAQLQSSLAQVLRCAPAANAVTKALMLDVGNVELDALLDRAAGDFSTAVRGAEGREGTLAFVEKRLPSWAEKQL